MTAPETLLQMDSVAAVYRMGQDALNEGYPTYRAEWYSITPPFIAEDGLMEVVFTLEKIKTPVQHWDALQQFTIRYSLLSIQSILPEGIEVSGLLPTTVEKMVRVALSNYNVPVVVGEFEITPVTEEGVVSVTPRLGYRWKGMTSIQYIKRRIPLNELIGRHDVVTNFNSLYSSNAIRDDIIDHVNRFNANRLPTPLNKGDVRFCLPTSIGTISSKVNTMVRLIANEGDYSGEGMVRYKRRDYQRTWRVPVELTNEGFIMTHDILPALSEKLGCRITPLDVINREIDGQEFIVDFNPTSLGYVGFIKIKLI